MKFSPLLNNNITFNPTYISPEYPQISTVTADGYLVNTPNTCKEYTLDHINYAFNGWQNYYMTALTLKPSLEEIRIYSLTSETVATNGLAILNQFEDQLGIPKSVVNTAGKGFVFRGSPRWLIAPPMVSLYTTLMRCGVYHSSFESLLEKVNTQQINKDEITLFNAKRVVDFMLKSTEKPIFGENAKANWPDKNRYIHYWGISLFGSGEIRRSYSEADTKLVEGWYKNLL